MIAADAGPMQIQWWEGAALSFAQTVQQDTTQRHCVLGNWLRRKSVGKTVVEPAGERDRLGGKAERCGAPRSAWSSRVGEVVSCRSGDHRWGTKLDFGWGEPFDDLHRSTALRAAPKIGSVFGGRGVLFGLRLLFRTQQLKAKR